MVKVFLAAIEAFPFVWKQHPPFMLASYLYARNFTKAKDELFWEEAKGYQRLMIDSGAHTYFVFAEIRGSKRFKNKKMKAPPPPEEYTHDYCKWLKEKGNTITTYVELDIDAIVGWQKQLDLRAIFESYNLAPLYVWHEANEWSFETYCQKCDFVGISGIEMDDNAIKKKLEIADRYGTDVHVFGYTRTSEIDGLRFFRSFFSCDSSSWMMGGKYVKPYKYEGGKLCGISELEFRKRFATTTHFAFRDVPWQERVQWNLNEFLKAVKDWNTLYERDEGQQRFAVVPPIGAAERREAQRLKKPHVQKLLGEAL